MSLSKAIGHANALAVGGQTASSSAASSPLSTTPLASHHDEAASAGDEFTAAYRPAPAKQPLYYDYSRFGGGSGEAASEHGCVLGLVVAHGSGHVGVGNGGNQLFQQQQCGLCGKEPMANGKTLVGCLHSFCQACLIHSTMNGRSQIQSGLNGLGSSVITCPVCSQVGYFIRVYCSCPKRIVSCS